MRRLAILLVAAVAAVALTVTAAPPDAPRERPPHLQRQGSGTLASGMIAHSCLTLWYGGQRDQPFCWESRLEGI